jgi:hypothetical protein
LLRNHDWRFLGVRWDVHQLHGRQGSRGKQRNSQVCHVLWVPGKFRSGVAAETQVKLSTNISVRFRSSGHFTEPRFELLNGYTSDQRTSVRPECGGFQTGTEIYFRGCAVSTRGRSRRIQGQESNRLGYRRRG